jgi:uncharacterized protein YcgL (UPF0745 family)
MIVESLLKHLQQQGFFLSFPEQKDPATLLLKKKDTT